MTFGWNGDWDWGSELGIGFGNWDWGLRLRIGMCVRFGIGIVKGVPKKMFLFLFQRHIEIVDFAIQ